MTIKLEIEQTKVKIDVPDDSTIEEIMYILRGLLSICSYSPSLIEQCIVIPDDL